MTAATMAEAERRIERAAETDADRLDLGNLQLRNVPTSLSRCKSLRSLALGDNLLTALPPAICELPDLERLSLANNRLSAIDPSIGALSKLIVLDVSENRLTSIAEEVGALHRLRQLDLFGNRLTSLPGAIWRGSNLAIVELSNNRLADLPDLEQAGQLVELHLANNVFTAVSPMISRLSRLRLLDLSGNQLRALDVEPHDWTSLEELVLDNNQLSDLDSICARCPNLTLLLASGNPLHDVSGPAYHRIQQRREQVTGVVARLATHPGGHRARRKSTDLHFSPPALILDALVTIAGVGGVINAVNLYYKIFRGASVELRFPHGSAVRLQNIPRSRALTLVRQHEEQLAAHPAVLRVTGPRSSEEFAVEVLTRISSAHLPAPDRREHVILFLAANPIGADPRALDAEARAIHLELKRGGRRDDFDLVTRWAAEPLDLLRELRELKPTVVHFAGRGPELEHGLIFAGPDGQPRVVPTAALDQAFGAAGPSVRLVVLSACYSEAQANALARHVDCVIGMAGSIGDDVTRNFALGFYGGLGAGESVEAAYRQGCAAISLEGLPDSDRPKLAVRDGIDPSDVVLSPTISAPR